MNLRRLDSGCHFAARQRLVAALTPLIVVASMAGGSTPAGDRVSDGCVRPPATAVRPVMVLSRTAVGYPCRLTVSDLPVTLKLDEEGKVDDIGNNVFRHPNGTYYSYTTRGEVTVWSGRGEFARSFGRAGQGPGEFAIGPLSIHFDSRGNTYIRDNNLRWSMFGPSNQLVQTLSAAGIGYSHDHSSFLTTNEFLTSEMAPPRSTHYFHVYDFAQHDGTDPRPKLVRSFGTMSSQDREAPPTARSRLISQAQGGTFWAAPSAPSGRGYELEQWSETGQLLRTIRREASWFPADAPAERGREDRPPARIAALHQDSTGLLFVQTIVPNRQWVPASGTPAQRRAFRLASFDVYVDVIDVRASVVLASEGPIPAARFVSDFPRVLFKGTRTGFRRVETAEGESTVRIAAYELIGN